MVENQDFSTVEFCQVFKQFKTESGKSVSTGNNNCELTSLHKSFQYGSKSFPFVVESSANVKDDFRFRKKRVHVRDLPGEVVFLFTAADSTVTDGDWLRGLSFSQSGKTNCIEQSIPAWGSLTFDGAIVCVFPVKWFERVP
ncbi:hypothetical protein [Moorena sp. SIO3B2]|uniref:hypothetical protein n=1 Tax=Moorena sp. SIO3B2 TaxID=2607827 RepID=UPI0013CC0851|nr:hypothetical protein [Moorena sp. SIO3B2]NEP37232.1 hypothetical protein [Moorena sp. SIO3B2]